MDGDVDSIEMMWTAQQPTKFERYKRAMNE